MVKLAKKARRPGDLAKGVVLAQQVYRWACAVLAMSIVASATLMVYAASMWDVALPSFDVTQYGEFLLEASRGNIDWSQVWAPHNDIHRIAWPKLVWALDAYQGSATGNMTRAIAMAAVLATWALVLRLLWCLPDVGRQQRCLFMGMASLLMTSIYVGESLLSPINIQWALLALGLVLIAYGLAVRGVAGWLCVPAGFVLAAGSGGPWALLLLAMLFSLWLVHAGETARRWAGRCFWLLLLIPVWDLLIAPWQGSSALAMLYAPLLPVEQWPAINDRILEGPLPFFVGWLWQKLVFFARYVMVPFPGPDTGDSWLGWVSLLWLFLILRSKQHWRATSLPWVFLCLAAALIAVGAGAVRLYFANYNYRHANIGMLLLIASMVLLYVHANRRPGLRALSFAACVYALLFMTYATKEAGIWSEGGRCPLAEKEVAHAIGVRDTEYLKWVWDVPDPQVSQHLRQAWQAQGIGVFASAGYRVYAGLDAIPEQEQSCQHRIIEAGRFTADARDWQLRGESMAANGDAVTSAVFFADGQPVGYAVYRLPSANLLQQWQEPWQWSGHAVLGDMNGQQVTMVAYNAIMRCQPLVIPLP